MELMRAIVATGPDEYSVQKIAKPVPGPGEVLCRIRSVAICGSDINLYNGKSRENGWPPAYPFVFGHEWAGEVVELGPGAECFHVGDRVAGEGHCGCGLCENCRKGQYTLCLNYGRLGHHHYGYNTNGAYAEYAVYREKALQLMPDNVSFDEATMCDTGGTALHGNEVIGVGSSDVAVIFGPGPVGNLTMQTARLKGAYTIVVGCHDKDRLRIAKECGADVVLDYDECDPVEEILKLTNGLGASAVLECAGPRESIRDAFRVVAKDGRVSLIAIPKEHEMPLPVMDIVLKQIHISGSRANPNCSKEVLDHISRGQLNVKKLITHHFTMEQMHEALHTFSHKLDGVMKVIINP